ncbi:MAG TPA: hypothetical protein VNN10_01765 [Dehalococcoidia bacterium]|nr:hypothetical protein [Dehalococcoidia bacterium]
MDSFPVRGDLCEDCGLAALEDDDSTRCPACFERELYSLDVGFLDSYRKFGARGRLVVAETCMRGLVLASPEHRKVLAMQIFEQYVLAMSDLVALFTALMNRDKAPIMKTFMEFRLDHSNAMEFFEAVQAVSDFDLCRALGLPLPAEVPSACPHLDKEDAYQLSVSIHHLVQDLRRTTEKGGAAALALAQVAGQLGGAVISPDTSWLEGARRLPPDQVALLVLDGRRRSIHVQAVSADEDVMGRVVDAIDSVTRASSNLIYSYLQTNDL